MRIYNSSGSQKGKTIPRLRSRHPHPPRLSTHPQSGWTHHLPIRPILASLVSAQHSSPSIRTHAAVGPMLELSNEVVTKGMVRARLGLKGVI